MALTPGFAQPLTHRELQVVSLVRKAMRNKEIAHKLSLTEGTVKEYLFTIFRKVGVTNRTELALWALEAAFSGQVLTAEQAEAIDKFWAAVDAEMGI